MKMFKSNPRCTVISPDLRFAIAIAIAGLGICKAPGIRIPSHSGLLLIIAIDGIETPWYCCQSPDHQRRESLFTPAKDECILCCCTLASHKPCARYFHWLCFHLKAHVHTHAADTLLPCHSCSPFGSATIKE